MHALRLQGLNYLVWLSLLVISHCIGSLFPPVDLRGSASSGIAAEL